MRGERRTPDPASDPAPAGSAPEELRPPSVFRDDSSRLQDPEGLSRSMLKLDYAILILSVILLWIPRPWMSRGRLGGEKRRSASPPAAGPAPDSPLKKAGGRTAYMRNYDLDFIREVKDARNWLDFFRALVAGYGLFESGIAGVALVDLPLAQSGPVIAAQIAVVAVAVALQVPASAERGVLHCHAPVFFIQGLLFGLVDWRAGLVAAAIAWTNTPLLKTPLTFLPVTGAVAALFSLCIDVHPVYRFTALGVTLLPVGQALLMKERLVTGMTRKLPGRDPW
ncbi:hypothetical protein OpiT1DRAFT_05727 [Opitutaceae bacterium TAV1]|nr:hypothetical protein OpiT1DRAFT_05727 [Opitutaceae bacterium TAV1]